jgi:hypothetical protein
MGVTIGAGTGSAAARGECIGSACQLRPGAAFDPLYGRLQFSGNAGWRFGALAWEKVRACRLVIDTGLHTGKLSRREAVRTFMAATQLGTEATLMLVAPAAAGAASVVLIRGAAILGHPADERAGENGAHQE